MGFQNCSPGVGLKIWLSRNRIQNVFLPGIGFSGFHFDPGVGFIIRARSGHSLSCCCLTGGNGTFCGTDGARLGYQILIADVWLGSCVCPANWSWSCRLLEVHLFWQEVVVMAKAAAKKKVKQARKSVAKQKAKTKTVPKKKAGKSTEKGKKVTNR